MLPKLPTLQTPLPENRNRQPAQPMYHMPTQPRNPPHTHKPTRSNRKIQDTIIAKCDTRQRPKSQSERPPQSKHAPSKHQRTTSIRKSQPHQQTSVRLNKQIIRIRLRRRHTGPHHQQKTPNTITKPLSRQKMLQYHHRKPNPR